MEASLISGFIDARRKDGKVLPNVEDTLRKTVGSDHAMGFRIQRAIVASRALGEVKGYKIGPAKVKDFSQWNLQHPGYAPAFETYHGNASRPAIFERCKNVAVVEAEVAFIVGAETDTYATYSSDKVWTDVISHVACAFEFVGSRLLNASDATPAQKIADCANNVAIIVGDARASSSMSKESIPSLRVNLFRNDSLSASGYGSSGSFRSSPLESMTWLVNHLSQQGIALRRGDVVVTGACTLTKDIEIGAKYTAEFEGIGSVSCVLTRPQSPARL